MQHTQGDLQDSAVPEALLRMLNTRSQCQSSSAGDWVTGKPDGGMRVHVPSDWWECSCEHHTLSTLSSLLEMPSFSPIVPCAMTSGSAQHEASRAVWHDVWGDAIHSWQSSCCQPPHDVSVSRESGNVVCAAHPLLYCAPVPVVMCRLSMHVRRTSMVPESVLEL